MGSSNRPRPAELSDDELISAFLAVHDARCPNANCRYNLRGVESCQCPECGERIALRIASDTAPGSGYTAGFFGLTSSLLLAVIFAIQQLRFLPVLSVLAVFGAIGLGRALLRWHTSRHTFGSLPRHKRQERVVIAWLPTVLLVVLLLSL